MKTGSKIIVFLTVLFTVNSVIAQITAGKIVYERKTNLFKKFKENEMREWIKEENKNKTDVFELYFNDSLTLFKPQENELREKMDWTTSKNTTYQNFNRNKRLCIRSIWGEELLVQDSLYARKWKITENKRVICGFTCRKAIWQANDSTRIYAWYCNEISVSIGPESFFGLPGAILGLATEDGGVIYFAKTVQVSAIGMDVLLPKKTKTKIYTAPELRSKLEKEFGKEKWGKAMIAEAFGYW